MWLHLINFSNQGARTSIMIVLLIARPPGIVLVSDVAYESRS